MAEIKQPELRGEDEHGNVRPADDRFLSKADIKKRDAYVSKVQDAVAPSVASDPQEELPND